MANRCRQRLAGAGGLARRLFPEVARLFAAVMLPGVIGYLAALAMSVVEKRLLKWRSSGH
jgi:ABC-type nitrate/sulfonate/bicarbonate transport system permease component